MTTEPTRYRHRPIEITAMQWNPGNWIEASRITGAFTSQNVGFHYPYGMGCATTLHVDTPEGEQTAQPGDWVVRVDGGDWAVMAAADFAERYEPVPAVPAGRDALRDRIAAAIYEHMHPGSYWSDKSMPTDWRPTYLDEADAVLAVLPPPADRAAVLREAAVFVEAMNEGCGQTKPCASCDAREDAAGELRRMADEEQQQTETESLVAELERKTDGWREQAFQNSQGLAAALAAIERVRAIQPRPLAPDSNSLGRAQDNGWNAALHRVAESLAAVPVPSRAAVEEPATETGGDRPSVLCNRSVLRQPHVPHQWQPQPGMDWIDCPGLSGWEMPDDDHSCAESGCTGGPGPAVSQPGKEG